jgi:hypothetical protein
MSVVFGVQSFVKCAEPHLRANLTGITFACDTNFCLACAKPHLHESLTAPLFAGGTFAFYVVYIGSKV